MSLTSSGRVDDTTPILLAGMLLNMYVESDQNQSNIYTAAESHDYSLSREGWSEESAAVLKRDLEYLFNDYFKSSTVEVNTSIHNEREEDLIAVTVAAELISSDGKATELIRSFKIHNDGAGWLLTNVFI